MSALDMTVIPRPCSTYGAQRSKALSAQNIAVNSLRILKGPTVILSGNAMQPIPRPVPTPMSFPTLELPEDEPEDPSNLSELLKGGTPNIDPYVSFYDDIQGWEETKDGLVFKLLDNKANLSLKYLNVDGLPIESDGKERKQRKMRTKSGGKAKNNQGQNKSNNRNNGNLFGSGAEEEVNEALENIANSVDEYSVTEENNALADSKSNVIDNKSTPEKSYLPNTIAPILPQNKDTLVSSKNSRIVRNQSCTKTLEAPAAAPSLDYITIASTDRVATLRKKLISSANNAKSSWVGGINQTPDLGMAVLTGKKYQGSPKSDINYRNPSSRPQTAPSMDRSERNVQFQEDRMFLPVISNSGIDAVPIFPIVTKFKKPDKFQPESFLRDELAITSSHKSMQESLRAHKIFSQQTLLNKKKSKSISYASSEFNFKESTSHDFNENGVSYDYKIKQYQPPLTNVLDWIDKKVCLPETRPQTARGRLRYHRISSSATGTPRTF